MHETLYNPIATREHMKATPPSARRAIVIHSPHAGRSASLSHALAQLRRSGIEIALVLPISAVASAPVLAQEWKNNGIDLVVAAGGDGLVGGLIAHVLDCHLPIGILPLGTANDLARSLGIPQDIASAVKVIASGVHRVIDLGSARPLVFSEQSDPDAYRRPSQQRLFAHALTVGLSVQFASVATNRTVRQRYGHLTYPFALWQAFKTYRPIDAECHFEGVARRTPLSPFPIATEEHLILRSRIAQCTAVNAPIFWGPFEGSVPGVSFTDRLLDIVIFEDTSRPHLAWRMLHFFNSRHQRSPDKQGWHTQYPDLLPAELTNIPGVHHVQARNLTLFTEDEPQAVTLDGEVCTQTPVEVRVADEQLRLLVPASPFTQ
jgi:diacylglycerol kinase (ATP)